MYKMTRDEKLWTYLSSRVFSSIYDFILNYMKLSKLNYYELEVLYKQTHVRRCSPYGGTSFAACIYFIYFIVENNN